MCGALRYQWARLPLIVPSQNNLINTIIVISNNVHNFIENSIISYLFQARYAMRPLLWTSKEDPMWEWDYIPQPKYQISYGKS